MPIHRRPQRAREFVSRIPARIARVTRNGQHTRVLGLAVAVMLGIAGNPAPVRATANVAITVAPGVVVLPLGARTQLGFQFGPVDGVMGGVKESPNQYRSAGRPRA